MKTLRIIPIVTITSLFFASCGDSKDDKAESQPSTVIIKNNDSKPAESDEGSSLKFNIETDKDGKVSAGVSGEVKAEDK